MSACPVSVDHDGARNTRPSSSRHPPIKSAPSPATHGADLVSSRGTRSYGVPFGSKTGGGGPFTRFDSTQQYKVRNPYRELQASMVGFFETAFAGQAKLVPPPAPRRDTDDDGKPDADDDNPSRP